MNKIRKTLLVLGSAVLLSACPTPTDPSSGGDAPPSSAKEITAFTFASADNGALSVDVEANISGGSITATMPPGTSVTNLVASFMTTGSSVSVNGTTQTSGTTVNDFTGPVTYTVTAADGSTRDYLVNVTVAAVVEGPGFDNATAVGAAADLTFDAASEVITLVYAQDQAEISFPAGTDDNQTATVLTQFWMAETELTNAAAAAILQWAYDNGKFSSDINDPNGLDETVAKHGGQQLIALNLDNQRNSRVSYDGSGTFSVDSGYEDHAVHLVSWYGAVMFANWLTEMRDGHTDNLVYTGIDPDWDHDETVEHRERSGYRLPTSEEWEYAARYLGTTAPSTGENLDSDRLAGDDDPDWTDGYYWTPGNYLSGATTYHDDVTGGNPPAGKLANDEVAVYSDYWIDIDPPIGEADDVAEKTNAPSEPEAVAGLRANELGLYDMSGNVKEWTMTRSAGFGGSRLTRGGKYTQNTFFLMVGNGESERPDTTSTVGTGLRLVRTAD